MKKLRRVAPSRFPVAVQRLVLITGALVFSGCLSRSHTSNRFLQIAGRTVVFESEGLRLYDRLCGETRLLCELERQLRSAPDASSDAHFVVFATEDSSVVFGDSNAECDVFVCDTLTGEVRRISVPHGDTETNGPSRPWQKCQISPCASEPDVV